MAIVSLDKKAWYMTRRSLLGRGAASSAALLAACGQGGATESGQGAPAAGGKVVELRAHARANSEKDGYQKNIDAFNQQYQGKFRAIYEGLAGNPDYYGPLETLMAGGTLGDVFYAHTSNLKFQAYAARGIALALDDLAAKDKNFKLADWPQKAGEEVKMINSKLYGLPTRGQVSWLFLYWNKDMLSKAGVPEPTPNWTLDDLVANAKKLVGQGPSSDFFPVLHGSGSGYEQAVANVRRFGGEFFQENGGPAKKCNMDSAPCLQAIKWYADNIKSGLFGPRGYAATEFGQGKGAFYFGRLAGERGTVANTAGTNFQWTFDVVPKGPTGKRGGFLSIDMSEINAQTKSRDGSWELLKWITNRDSGVNLALQPSGSLTPGYRKDVYCDDRLLNDSRFPKSAMKANCDNIDQPDSYVFPANLRLTEPGAIQTVLDTYLNDMMDLKMEVTPATMKQMTQEIQNVLDQPHI